jgi:hypothetical protein
VKIENAPGIIKNDSKNDGFFFGKGKSPKMAHFWPTFELLLFWWAVQKWKFSEAKGKKLQMQN